MKGSHGAAVRAAALAVAGIAALAAGALSGPGARPALLLAAVGGFALGAAASLGRAGARAGGRAEGEGPGAQRAGQAAAPTPGAVALERTHAGVATGQGVGVAAVARSTVAAVAHDMSNPLASLRANLEWLRDALDAGRLEGPEEQAEAREVLRDAREAAERLRVDVGALRAAGRGEATAPPHA